MSSKLSGNYSWASEPALNSSSHRISQSLVPKGSTKRRKIDGLNSRFDRMIETVNVVHTVDTATSNRSGSRRRRATSGSSSTISYDTPKTPVDTYDKLEGGRLGEDFSVLKMRSFSGHGYGTPHDTPDRYDLPATGSHEDGPPAWLSETVAELAPTHPLRELIPVPRAHIPSSSTTDDALKHPYRLQPTTSLPEDDVFAFRPPSQHLLLPSVAPLVQEPHQDHAAILSSPMFSNKGTTSTPAPREQVFKEPHRPRGPYGDEYTTPLRPKRPLVPAMTSKPDHGYPLPVDDDNLTYVPFSTPGPCSRHNQTDIDRELASPNDLDLPFSKPGPLVRPIRSSSPLYTPFHGSSSDYSCSSSKAPSKDNGNHSQNPQITQLAYRSVSSSPARFPEPIAVLPTPVIHEHILDDDTGYSTPEQQVSPGPLHPRYRVYFDTPIEDPVGSDPLERPEYELDLDYGALDFHWTKFDRSSDSNNTNTRPAAIESTVSKDPRKLYDDDTALEDRVSSPRDDATLTDQTLHVESEDARPTEVEDASDPSTIVQNTLENSVPFQDSPASEVAEQPADNSLAESNTRDSTQKSFSTDPILSVQSAPVEKRSEEPTVACSKQTTPTSEKASKELDTYSLPRTPVNQIGSALPRTPALPRKLTAHRRAPSLPPITVLKQEPDEEDEDVVESEPKLSQNSHDTIESWSAP